MRGVILRMPLDMLGGIAAFGAILLGIVGLRFAIALANASGDEGALSTAFARTGRWSLMLASGIGSAAAVGLIQFGDLVGGAFAFLVGHPYFASNFGILGIGAGALSGLVSLSPQQFVGIGIMIVGIVMVSVEADNVV